jgi:hypothetical protein
VAGQAGPGWPGAALAHTHAITARAAADAAENLLRAALADGAGAADQV